VRVAADRSESPSAPGGRRGLAHVDLVVQGSGLKEERGDLRCQGRLEHEPMLSCATRSSNRWKGGTDEVVVDNTALTATQVNKHYNAGRR